MTEKEPNDRPMWVSINKLKDALNRMGNALDNRKRNPFRISESAYEQLDEQGYDMSGFTVARRIAIEDDGDDS